RLAGQLDFILLEDRVCTGREIDVPRLQAERVVGAPAYLYARKAVEIAVGHTRLRQEHRLADSLIVSGRVDLLRALRGWGLVQLLAQRRDQLLQAVERPSHRTHVLLGHRR